MSQNVYRADHQNPKFWANGFIRLRLLRETPFETTRSTPSGKPELTIGLCFHPPVGVTPSLTGQWMVMAKVSLCLSS